ncbi:hypothetical protein GGF44_000097, partial [Coemansia sp. RSA 1694]
MSGQVSCDMNQLKEVLSVCYIWRQTALEYMWKDLRLYISEDEYAVRSERPAWFDCYWLPPTTEYFVREITISIRWTSLLDGTAFELLSNYMGYTTVLPQVHRLRIIMFDELGRPEYIDDSTISNV